jgi:hypothetical protein
MNRRKMMLIFGILTLVAVVALVATADETEEGPEDHGTRGAEDNSYMDSATYVGSDTCKACHPAKYDTWVDSLHNKKVMTANSLNVTGDFTVDPVIGGLGTIDLYYDPIGDIYHATVGPINYTIDWALGSGYWKQRYMVEIGNSTYILPIQYNTATQEWVSYHPENWNATTGDKTSFDNSWEKNCMGCHSTGYEVSENVNGEWVGTYSELNVACEACHGPGSDHAGDPDYIWLDYSSDTCSLCHVRGKSKDGNHGYPDGMLPGDNIFDFYDMDAGLWGDGNTSKKHHQQWVDWNTTYDNGHAEWAPSFAQSDSCMSCRSVEGFLEGLGQWDRDEDDIPDAKNATWQQTCVSCHDTHPEDDQEVNEHQLRLERDDICMSCHTYGDAEYSDSPHHPQREVFTGNTAAGVLGELSGEPGMLNQTTCADCHMPFVAKSAINYDISSHTFRPIMPEDGIAFGMPDSCTAAPCHTTMSQENAQEIIDNWQDRFDEEFEEAEEIYEEAHHLRESALENMTLSENLNESYLKAAFNFHLLENEHEGSKGVHNPDFLFDLLEDVEIHSEEVIEGLSMGTITGTVTDGTDPISGAYVVVDGSGAITGEDGTYSVNVETSAAGETYTIEAYMGGYTVYTSAGEIEVYPGATMTHDIDLSLDTDYDGTPDATDDDDDNDGYNDTVEGSEGSNPTDSESTPTDTDMDYIPDSTDTDDDGDGVLDADDTFPTNPSEWVDSDGDDIGDNKDTDDDGDGVADTADAAPWDSTVTTIEPEIVEKEVKEDADSTMYLVAIIVLIVVIVLLFVMMMKKGGSKPSLPPEEPPEEPPVEEEVPEEEE